MVAATEGFKVLGTQFTLVGRTSKELTAHIAAAWGKFHQLRPLLMKRDGDLHKRLRLFDMSVTQTLLWCSESWLLTQEEKRHLKSTQNTHAPESGGRTTTARCELCGMDSKIHSYHISRSETLWH